MNNNRADHADNEAVVALAQEIRSYLADRPNAEDTLQGVAQWWLARQRVQHASRLVQRALDYLVTQGVVERRSLPDGRETYAGRQRKQQH